MAKAFRNPQAVRAAATDEPGRFGIGAWIGRPGRMARPHRHSDIEFNFVVRGGMSYLLAGGTCPIRPRRLAMFWAGAPHVLTHVLEDTETIWVVVPLAWFLQWQPPARFVRRLLAGELVQEPDAVAGPADEALLRRWVADTRSRSAALRAAAMLEMEARCKRLAHRLESSIPPPRAAHEAASHVERIAAYAARHYAEPVAVADLAAAAGLNPHYAMTLFKDACGLSIWDYVTRLRVSHAQRLLLTTDWKVQRVALQSGFGTLSSFYEAFARVVGRTPAAYRRAIG